jgi:hypothetical protein
MTEEKRRYISYLLRLWQVDRKTASFFCHQLVTLYVARLLSWLSKLRREYFYPGQRSDEAALFQHHDKEDTPMNSRKPKAKVSQPIAIDQAVMIEPSVNRWLVAMMVVIVMLVIGNGVVSPALTRPEARQQAVAEAVPSQPEEVIGADNSDQSPASPAERLPAIKVFEVFPLTDQPDPAGQAIPATTPERGPVEDDDEVMERTRNAKDLSPLKVVKRFTFGNHSHWNSPLDVAGYLTLAEGSATYLVLSFELTGLTELESRRSPLKLKELFYLDSLPPLDRQETSAATAAMQPIATDSSEIERILIDEAVPSQKTVWQVIFNNDRQFSSPGAVNGKATFAAGSDPYLLLDLEVMPHEAAN